MPAGATTSAVGRPTAARANPAPMSRSPVPRPSRVAPRSARRALHPADRSIPRTNRPPSRGRPGSRLPRAIATFTRTTTPAVRCNPAVSGTSKATAPTTRAKRSRGDGTGGGDRDLVRGSPSRGRRPCSPRAGRPGSWRPAPPAASAATRCPTSWTITDRNTSRVPAAATTTRPAVGPSDEGIPAKSATPTRGTTTSQENPMRNGTPATRPAGIPRNHRRIEASPPRRRAGSVSPRARRNAAAAAIIAPLSVHSSRRRQVQGDPATTHTRRPGAAAVGDWRARRHPRPPPSPRSARRRSSSWRPAHPRSPPAWRRRGRRSAADHRPDGAGAR